MNVAHLLKPQPLIRVRIWPLDYNGNKSNMTYVTYVVTLSDAALLGWKYEIRRGKAMLCVFKGDKCFYKDYQFKTVA
jgi:hypothetical protein